LWLSALLSKFKINVHNFCFSRTSLLNTFSYPGNNFYRLLKSGRNAMTLMRHLTTFCSFRNAVGIGIPGHRPHTAPVTFLTLMHLGVVVCTAALNWFQFLPLGFVPVSCWRQNQYQTGYLDRCMVAAGVTDPGCVWSCVWSGPPASALRLDRGSPRVLTCVFINWRSCSVPVSRASDPCIGYLRRQ